MALAHGIYKAVLLVECKHQRSYLHRGEDIGFVGRIESVLGAHAVENLSEYISIVDIDMERCAASLVKLFRTHFLDDVTMFDEAVVGSKTRQLVKDMAGDKDSDAFLLIETHDHLTDLDDTLRVETVDGFVKNEKLGIAHERERDTQSLTHTEREVLGFLFTRICKTDQLEDVVKLLIRDTESLCLLDEVILSGHFRVERGSFNYRAHFPACLKELAVIVLDTEK